MHTASIRIKFMPLVKTINRENSKCCLEIIPELSYVENIDKIEWKKENDFIEYVVPMNYRIVFKKLAPSNGEDPNKIYYSCVDLLHSTSINKIELGSGDVSRVVSDNAILKEITSKMKNNEKCKIMLTKIHTLDLKKEFMKEDGKSKENIREKMKEGNMHEKSFIDFKDDIYIEDKNQLKTNHFDAVKNTVSVQIQISKRHIYENKVDIISGKGNAALESNFIKPKSIETLTNLNARLDPKLTLTSFLSFDTNLKPLLKTVYQNNSFFNPNMYCTRAANNTTLKDDTEVLKYNTLVNDPENAIRRTYKENSSDQRYHSELNVLPALQLNYFKHIMEKEMLPLRITLNEIINKCISLGITKKKSTLKKPMSYLSYSNTYTNSENCHKEHKLASNRVVYSFVFNK